MVFIDPMNYLKYYPPGPVENNDILEVNVFMMLLTIEKIMEIDMTFDTKFGLVLEWKDRRITYYNLKKQNQANIVSYLCYQCSVLKLTLTLFLPHIKRCRTAS